MNVVATESQQALWLLGADDTFWEDGGAFKVFLFKVFRGLVSVRLLKVLKVLKLLKVLMGMEHSGMSVSQ